MAMILKENNWDVSIILVFLSKGSNCSLSLYHDLEIPSQGLIMLLL